MEKKRKIKMNIMIIDDRLVLVVLVVPLIKTQTSYLKSVFACI